MIGKADKKIVGFTAGNFDIIHPGYVYTFQTAKKHCDYFMVFLQNDPSLDRENKYTSDSRIHQWAGFVFFHNVLVINNNPDRHHYRRQNTSLESL